MQSGPQTYTPAQAGAVSGLSLKAVNNAIDKQIVKPVRGVASARTLSVEDLLRLRLWRGVGETLSAERRQRLFQEVADQPNALTVKADDLLIVDVGEARRQVDHGVRELEAAQALVVRDKGIMGGEPVFCGTRVPVRGIAEMLEAGATAEEILSGYPSLTGRMVELSRVWATAHPRRGRPKSLSALGLTLTSSKRIPRKPLTAANV